MPPAVLALSFSTFMISLIGCAVINWVVGLEKEDGHLSWKDILLISLIAALLVFIISFIIASIDRDLFIKMIS